MKVIEMVTAAPASGRDDVTGRRSSIAKWMGAFRKGGKEETGKEGD